MPKLMELHRKKKPCGIFAVVDDDCPEEILRVKWGIKRVARSRTTYVHGTWGGDTVTLHRAIMNAGPGDEVDHIDGDGLNNCRANLRLVSHAENIAAAYRQAPFAWPAHYTGTKVVKRRLATGEVREYRYPSKRYRASVQNRPGTFSRKRLENEG